MHFKTKVTLIISLLICISLTAFGVVSYIDTKKNSLSSTARMLSDIENMSEAQAKAILQETTKASEGRDSFLGIESSGIMIYGSNTIS